AASSSPCSPPARPTPGLPACPPGTPRPWPRGPAMRASATATFEHGSANRLASACRVTSRNCEEEALARADCNTQRTTSGRFPRTTSAWRRYLPALVLLVLSGCNTRPRAPALVDEPIYQNEREGLRFLVPEGWKQLARADVPPGKVDRERLLVQYRRLLPGQEATLEVRLADLPTSAALDSLLSAPSYGVDRW